MINPLEKLFEELCNAFKDLIKKNIKFKGKLKGIEAKLEALKPVIQDMLQSNEVLDRSSNELKGLTEVIESGIELIVKCSKSRVWELFKKYKYANKLIEWEESLGSKFDILKVQTSRDVKDIAREVKETGVVVQDTAREVKETAVVVQDTEREVKETGVVVQDTAREVKGTGVVLQDTAREVKEIAATLKNVEASVENILIVIQNQPGESKAWMTTEVPELPGNTVGLDTHVKELNMKLVKDGGSMLVITAPGGSGKTTLAKMLYHDDQVKDGAFSTKWHDMELPVAEVLVLNFQTKNYALPQFVEKMVKLKVLVVTNYGIVPSELTNFEILCASSYLKRMKLERISIPSIAKHPMQLNGLQKISLFMV
ncbi:uncharacterized protein LOC112190622 isoform X1 [Rosa chinensis]|uniref:uncharacterized protein LOC112190622 isoform X1 n=1 Tax=Rosa chinensis TaxID=74649 RepID=UPI000D087203|nr:uncharacterized protein LOC112190622 isoform X1 [Rosa chinensis]XP_024185842.1 uncharacterized protein LOC112190622 isoform X1 [Rosa chinensis]